MKDLLAIGVASALAIGCASGEATEQGASSAAPAPAEAEPATTGTLTVVEFNQSDLPTVDLLVPDIHCEGCAAGVRSALVEVAGVQDVRVDVETKVATVAIDEAVFETDVAIAALSDASFADSSPVTDVALTPDGDS